MVSKAVARRGSGPDLRVAWVAWQAGRPATTQRARVSDLERLAAFVRSTTGAGPSSAYDAAELVVRLGPSEARALVHAWQAFELERCVPATVARRVATVCSWVRACAADGLGWVLDVRRPRVAPYQARACPTWGHVEAVLERLEREKRYRDVALLLLLADVGLRRAEVVGLDVDDVDLEGPSVTATRKGGVVVTRTVSARAAAALRRVIGRRRSGPLFVSDARGMRGGVGVGRLTDGGLAYLTMRWGLGRPHRLRTAGATELHRTTHDPVLVQYHLGHRNLSTTQVYVHTLEDHAGKATRVLAGESE